MANDFGTGKSILILAIVAGCFALLWPNVFYPMITGTYPQKSDGYSGGCCDVIFDNDINAIKIMFELCENILMNENKLDNRSVISLQQGKLTKEILELCQKSVLEKCELNITELLRRKAMLGKEYRHTLDLVRTLNSSICLRESFGISLGQIGLPRRMRVWGVNISKHFKQERPPHLHPEMMHPALREKGRAIPQSHAPKIIQEGRPGPVPGMRPPMGGPGHVVPPPKGGGGGTMGIVMPMYTIGIVIFFLYTMMKLLFRKSSDTEQYEEFVPDTDFRREVFGLNSGYCLPNGKEKKSEEGTRLVVSAITGLVQEVNKQICSEQNVSSTHNKAAEELDEKHNKEGKESEDEKGTSRAAESPSKKEKIPEKLEKGTEKGGDDDQGEEVKAGVKVLGMETTESCESGKWSRPSTPRPPTPQNIYLSGKIPDQSQLLVTDSTTESVPDSDNSIVLSGKVTLSLIGFQEPEENFESQPDSLSESPTKRNDSAVKKNPAEQFGDESTISSEKTNAQFDGSDSGIQCKDMSASVDSVHTKEERIDTCTLNESAKLSPEKSSNTSSLLDLPDRIDNDASGNKENISENIAE